MKIAKNAFTGKHGAASLFKISLVAMLALVNMGNEGCEKTEEEPGRKLRKRASISKITTPKDLALPGGDRVDFSYLANSQISHVVSEHDEFIPSQGAYGVTNSFSEMGALSYQDFSTMLNWERKYGVSVLSLSDSSPNCIRYAPMVDISGAIESFEIVGSGGLTFGFGPNVPGNPARVAAKFFVQRAKLHANFQAYHPLRLESPLATGRVPANHTTVDIEANIDFGLARVGLSWFYETPLAEASYNALSASLKDMAQDYDRKASANNLPVWETKLREDHDQFVTIYGGAHDGLQVGDEIEIYNVNYFWTGEPCKSRFEGSSRVRKSGPDGIYRIVDTLDFISRAEPVVVPSSPLKPGAQVLLHRFAGDYETEGNLP